MDNAHVCQCAVHTLSDMAVERVLEMRFEAVDGRLRDLRVQFASEIERELIGCSSFADYFLNTRTVFSAPGESLDDGKSVMKPARSEMSAAR
jgi:hypothetical protein